MGMDINVRLGGSGGNSRQARLSGLKTAEKAQQTIQRAGSSSGSSNVFKAVNSAISKGTSFMSGSGGALASAIPIVGGFMIAARGAEKIINFGADIYAARSGEDMLASNIKANVKTGATFGLNLASGAVENYLFTEPRIARQNNMKEYNRELYFQNGYTRKNELT